MTYIVSSGALNSTPTDQHRAAVVTATLQVTTCAVRCCRWAARCRTTWRRGSATWWSCTGGRAAADSARLARPTTGSCATTCTDPPPPPRPPRRLPPTSAPTPASTASRYYSSMRTLTLDKIRVPFIATRSRGFCVLFFFNLHSVL